MAQGVMIDYFFMDPKTDSWIEQYGDFLYRYALARVQNEAAAEDLVQETFAAALKASFQKRSSEKTWLAGILKHKIVDHFRANAKTVSLDRLLDSSDPFEGAFDQTRHWKSSPRAWKGLPEKEAEAAELRKVLEDCLGRLPERMRELFLMRELDEAGSEELCKVFGLTPTNLWVILHRSRFQLKNCLEKNEVQ